MDEAFENQDYGKRVMEGSLTLDSAEAFEALLDKVPSDHLLIKAYADFLVGKESFAQASQYYRKAAELFGAEGMVLCAIASKVMEWKVAKPTRRECRSLYAAIREVRSEKPLDNFFCHMTYAELVAVMSRLDPVRMPAGAVIENSGGKEDVLCFIVSGTVAEVNFPQPGEKGPIIREYASQSMEANYFGDVYPFEEQRVSSSRFETVGACELLMINRLQLMDLCEGYPTMRILLMRLTKAHRLFTEQEGARKFRETVRLQLQTQAYLKILNNEPNGSQLVLKGNIEDISLGGACISLGGKYLTGPPALLIGKTVNVLVNASKVEVGLNLFGTIVWCREALREGKTMVTAGIQFKNLTHADLTFLKKNCYLVEEAQDFISYLWESQPKN
mgnify:CR=1 FL=1